MEELKIKGYIIIATVLIMIINTRTACAQLTGMQAMYFDDQYLANPAMAGLDRGMNFNVGYQHQWTTTPGGPKLQNFTVDYNSGNNVGLGFTVNGDDAGLISRTRILATYAYHLPVSENGKLSFGLSAGINDSYVDYSKIIGDQGDGSVDLFNNRRIYFDGDLGISFTSQGFNMQAALPNLGSVFFNNDNNTNLDVDRQTFYTAVSYKFPLDKEINNYMLEPKLAFRGVKGYINMGDIGANIILKEYKFNITAMYHTNQTFSTGIGIGLQQVHLLFSYTANVGPLRAYADNTFEFGFGYRLFSK